MSDRTDAAPNHAAAPDVPAAAPAERTAAPTLSAVAGVLSARETAIVLGVSERTVRRAIQRGEIVATKRAGSFQITSDAIDAFRRRDTGHRTLPHTTTPDSGAAAQDAIHDRAAATDSGQGAAEAVTVLRELLAEERQRADRLLEASTIWQGRAMQLEAQLKAIAAGPIAQDAGDVEDAAQDAMQGAPRDVAPMMAAETLQKAQERPWWRRVFGR